MFPVRVLFVIFTMINCHGHSNSNSSSSRMTTDTSPRTNVSISQDDCSKSEYCQNCGFAGCVKCSNYIVYQSRDCVPNCPIGYISKWSTLIDYMGQVCIPANSTMNLSSKPFLISKDKLIITFAVMLALLVCLSLLIIGLIIHRLLQRKQMTTSLHEGDDKMLNRLESKEFQDFLQELDNLRPYAHFYLELLNDTRKQIRQYFHKGDNLATMAYKPIVRDLGRVLFLLNFSKNELIAIPDDWDRLYRWAEMLLDKFQKKNRNPALVNNCAQTMQFLTFKPSNRNVDLENTPSSSSYCLSDDFSYLGTRPQDQVCTEL